MFSPSQTGNFKERGVWRCGGQKQCQDFNPVQGTGSVCLHSRDKGLIALHYPAGKQDFPENRFTE